jgi:c-di-GMP-related signal transduction protein
MATSISHSVTDSPFAHGELSSAIAASDLSRYVARQPILDGRGLHGYELLFRCGPNARGFCGDGNSATRAVLDNTMTFGVERLTGGLPVFVNCTQESLEKRLVMVLPPAQTVLEILETLEPSDALFAACKELKAAGFRLALDDFEWKPEWARFVPLADYIKVDLSITTHEQRCDLMKRIKGSRALLVAERVETQEDLEQARSEGFTLFQGYYFCRPVLMENRAIPANRLVQLAMLEALHEEPLEVKRIANLVKRDASLTYRLLRMVNSPMYGVGKEVRSILGALVMVGDEMFRRVATLAIAGEIKGGQSGELLRMAFLRARFCELAARMTGQDATEQYLLGVVSLLPAMLRVPMEKIAETMPLRRKVRLALLGIENEERRLLSWLEAYEQGDWERCDKLAPATQLPVGSLPALYAEAMAWADKSLSFAAG